METNVSFGEVIQITKKLILEASGYESNIHSVCDRNKAAQFCRCYGITAKEILENDDMVADIAQHYVKAIEDSKRDPLSVAMDEAILGEPPELVNYCQLCGCIIRNGRCENKFCVNHY